MIAEPEAPATGYYLGSLLAPLAPWLTQGDVTDIYINREQEIWVETVGGAITRHPCHALSLPVLARLARQVAAASSQGINRAHPLLAASLPDGARIQVIGPPATRDGYAFAIRRQVAAQLTLHDMEQQGAFASAAPTACDPGSDAALLPVAPSEIAQTLRVAVVGKRNILISGGTSSGKTTFLNALLREVPEHERLVLIEDTAELELTHANCVATLAVRGDLGEAQVSAEDLLIAALRMRPDRIILGELRGHEAFTFLRAVNTGHPGSMTTIHADTPERAIEQLVLLVLQSGSRLSREDVRHYVRHSIDLFVQLGRLNGRRCVTQVLARAR